MGGSIMCSGEGKAASVVIREDDSKDVINWRLGQHRVPAVHRVRATLVHCPIQYYVHANYGPEVMAIRSENVARLRWSSVSFDLPLAPEIVGHFNLLSDAVEAAQKRFGRSLTKVGFRCPSIINLRSEWSGDGEFDIYLNLAAYEFYHLLFVLGPEGLPSSQFVADPIDVRTVPKLMTWVKRFEASKKKLYRDNGFDWNPRCGPIELGPTRGEL